jgi:hypothetical protein
MGKRRRLASLGRAEARIRTGPAAHLLGGGLDLLAAVVGLLFKRVRGRIGTSRSGPAGP